MKEKLINLAKNKKVVLISGIALALIAAIVITIILFPFGGTTTIVKRRKKVIRKTNNVISEITDNNSIASNDSYHDEDYNDAEEDYLKLNEFDYFSHQIVYSKNASLTQAMLVNRLHLKINKKYSTIVKPITDDKTSDEVKLELVIGDTNREISKTAYSILNSSKKSAMDYCIIERDGNISIAALSDSALENAINKFITDFLSKENPTIKKGYTYVYQKNPIFTYAEILGVDIRQWKIVVPSGASYIYIKYLDSMVEIIREATGYELPIVVDNKSPVSSYEILVGNTNRVESTVTSERNRYNLQINGSKIVVSGGHTYSIGRAVEVLCDIVKKSVNGKHRNLVERNLNISGTYAESDSNYNLVYADEFDDDSLSNWIERPGYLGTVTGIATGGTVTYVNDNRTRYVKDGNLVMRYYTEDYINWFQSPELVSRNSKTFDFGYIEMRAKLPQGSGVFPAFWLTRNYNAYPNSPEIDIMEQFGVDNTIASNIHIWWFEPDKTNTLVTRHIQLGNNDWFARSVTLPQGRKLSDAYHTYGCEITEEMISFYFDGIKYAEYSMDEDRMDMFAQLKEIRIGYNKIGSNSSVSMPDKTTKSDYCIDYIHLYQTKKLGTLSNHL